MEQNIIDNLPNILQHIAKLKYLSFDNDNSQYMTESLKTAINFDKVAKKYSKQNNLNYIPNSNDALYIDKDNNYYFIEFKNGDLIDKSKNVTDKCINQSKKEELKLKIYDSLFILSDIERSRGIKYIPNIVNFSKNKIKYILVYNFSKNGKMEYHNNVINNSEKELYKNFEMNSERLGLKKFEKFILKEIYIYDENEFETKFINGIIANES